MLFRSSSQGSLILILDIQSSIVRASLVHEKDKQLPSIVYAFTKNVPYRQNTGSSRIIQVTLDALKEIMADLHHFLQTAAPKHHLPTKVAEVHFVLSSPWVISQAKTLSHTFKQPVDVTQKLILDIIAKERGTIIPTAVQGNKVDIIEEKISNVRLNGYIVENWKNKRTKDLEVSFAVSVAGSNTAELFRHACTIVPRNRIYFHSSLLLQYIAIQQLMPSRSAYTLVHVHGELTDVAVINHHSCIFFGSYPTGVYSIIRKVARAGKTDVEVADSAIGMSSQNTLDGNKPTAIHAAIAEGAELWSSELKKMFETVTPAIQLPARTILCGHVHEDFFLKSLKKTYPHMQPEILTLEQIKPFVIYASSDEAIRLSGLYTMAIHSMVAHIVI
jgi:hypothetical protein